MPPPPASDAPAQQQQTIMVQPLTTDEEDQTILARITNEERSLRRVIKKFHHYTTLSHTPVVPHVPPPGAAPAPAAASIDDAREAFLVELSTLQLVLRKGVMTCEAEARQVEEYQREKGRINDEHGTLRGQIEQLKTGLEHEQMLRRRKMEYDFVAEKVNTLPTREELEQTINSLENDMAAIRGEHEAQNRTIQAQKAALDTIVSELGSLRFLGKDREAATSTDLSPRDTPGPEGSAEPSTTTAEGEATVPDKMEVEEGEEETAHESVVPAGEAGGDDIEMGEVEEEPKNSLKGGKKKREEELEEGEASETEGSPASSELSEPPDDD